MTDHLREWLGDTWQPPTGPSTCPSKFRRVVICGDLHADPHKGLTQQIIDLQPDILAVVGDLLDGDAPNSHVKLPGDPKPKDTRQEIAVIRAWFELMLDKTGADIWVTRGNHDDRYFRRAAEFLPDYLLDFFRDPLDMVVYGLPRVEIVSTPWTAIMPNGEKSDLGHSQYMLPLGDILLSHANFVGTEPGVAVRKLMQWHAPWRRTLDFDPTIFVQMHCHSQSLGAYDGGHVLLIEPGMLCNPSAEAWKLRYDLKWKSGVVGALYLEQNEIDGQWITDRRTVRILTP